MTTGNLIIQGNKLKREGKLDEAIALYTQAINLKPDFAFTYYELGDALEKQGNFAQAIIEYEKAIELNPRPRTDLIAQLSLPLKDMAEIITSSLQY